MNGQNQPAWGGNLGPPVANRQGEQREDQLADGLAGGRAVWLWLAGHFTEKQVHTTWSRLVN